MTFPIAGVEIAHRLFQPAETEVIGSTTPNIAEARLIATGLQPTGLEERLAAIRSPGGRQVPASRFREPAAPCPATALRAGPATAPAAGDWATARHPAQVADRWAAGLTASVPATCPVRAAAIAMRSAVVRGDTTDRAPAAAAAGGSPACRAAVGAAAGADGAGRSPGSRNHSR